MKRIWFCFLCLVVVCSCGIKTKKSDYFIPTSLIGKTVWYHDQATKKWISGVVTDEMILYRAQYPDAPEESIATVNGIQRMSYHLYFKKGVGQ